MKKAWKTPHTVVISEEGLVAIKFNMEMSLSQ